MKQKNKLGWTLYGICMFMLVLKFIAISWGQYGAFISAYSWNELTINTIKDLFFHRLFFIENGLLLISILGLSVRKKIGFILAGVFSYFQIIYFAYNSENWVIGAGPFTRSVVPLLGFALVILLLLNYSKTVKVFVNDWSYRKLFKYNLLSLVAGGTIFTIISVLFKY